MVYSIFVNVFVPHFCSCVVVPTGLGASSAVCHLANFHSNPGLNFVVFMYPPLQEINQGQHLLPLLRFAAMQIPLQRV